MLETGKPLEATSVRVTVEYLDATGEVSRKRGYQTLTPESIGTCSGLMNFAEAVGESVYGILLVDLKEPRRERTYNLKG